MATLTSKRYTVNDAAGAIDLCFEKGWTDGLPVVPPTEAAVRAMLDTARLAPEAQIAYIRDRATAVTAEKVAINAVMAGCRSWSPRWRASATRAGATTGPAPRRVAPPCC